MLGLPHARRELHHELGVGAVAELVDQGRLLGRQRERREVDLAQQRKRDRQHDACRGDLEGGPDGTFGRGRLALEAQREALARGGHRDQLGVGRELTVQLGRELLDERLVAEVRVVALVGLAEDDELVGGLGIDQIEQVQDRLELGLEAVLLGERDLEDLLDERPRLGLFEERRDRHPIEPRELVVVRLGQRDRRQQLRRERRPLGQQVLDGDVLPVEEERLAHLAFGHARLQVVERDVELGREALHDRVRRVDELAAELDDLPVGKAIALGPHTPADAWRGVEHERVDPGLLQAIGAVQPGHARADDDHHVGRRRDVGLDARLGLGGLVGLGVGRVTRRVARLVVVAAG